MQFFVSILQDEGREQRQRREKEREEGHPEPKRGGNGPVGPLSIKGSVSHGLPSILFLMGHDGRWACHQKTACPMQSEVTGLSMGHGRLLPGSEVTGGKGPQGPD